MRKWKTLIAAVIIFESIVARPALAECESIFDRAREFTSSASFHDRKIFFAKEACSFRGKEISSDRRLSIVNEDASSKFGFGASDNSAEGIVDQACEFIRSSNTDLSTASQTTNTIIADASGNYDTCKQMETGQLQMTLEQSDPLAHTIAIGLSQADGESDIGGIETQNFTCTIAPRDGVDAPAPISTSDERIDWRRLSIGTNRNAVKIACTRLTPDPNSDRDVNVPIASVTLLVGNKPRLLSFGGWGYFSDQAQRNIYSRIGATNDKVTRLEGMLNGIGDPSAEIHTCDLEVVGKFRFVTVVPHRSTQAVCDSMMDQVAGYAYAPGLPHAAKAYPEKYVVRLGCFRIGQNNDAYLSPNPRETISERFEHARRQCEWAWERD